MFKKPYQDSRTELGLYFSVCDSLIDEFEAKNQPGLESTLEVVAALGYKYLELSTHTSTSPQPNRFDVETMLQGKGRQIRRIIESVGLRISAINMSADGQLLLGPYHTDTDCIVKGNREEKIRYGIHRMMLSAELAHDLEIPVITGFIGCEDYSRWFPWPDPEAWEKMESVFVERLTPILNRFKELGVHFGMECHPRQFVYNTETAIRSLELLDHHSAWGFNLDPANLLLAGIDPVVFASEMGSRSRLFNVHAKDGELVKHNIRRSGLLAHGAWQRPDRGFRFRIPGWGDVAWRKLITELALQDYRGPLVVEHEDPTMGRMEGIEKAASFLSPLLIREPFAGRHW